MSATLQLASRNRAIRLAKPLLRWAAGRWPWPVQARLAQGPTMYVDLRSSIGRGIMVTGAFDALVFDPIAEVLAGGGNFLDIGANVGYYSVLAAHTLAGRGCVYAFEIDPRPLRCLRRNSLSFGKDRIVVEEVAVGATSSVVHLLPGKESGHTRVTPNGDGPSVPMITIDEWRRTNRIHDIRAIKIDIEGGEFAALRGARDTLEAERPTIVLEALESAEALGGASQAVIVDYLRQLRYSVSEVFGTHSRTLAARPERNYSRGAAR